MPSQWSPRDGGAGGGTRTHKGLRPEMCEISAFTGFATPAPRWLRTPVIPKAKTPHLTPAAAKGAVACALEPRAIASFRVVDERDRTIFGPAAADSSGPFGPCATTYRLDFSAVRQPGVYRIEAGDARSLPVRIADDVYRGAADSL